MIKDSIDKVYHNCFKLLLHVKLQITRLESES